MKNLSQYKILKSSAACIAMLLIVPSAFAGEYEVETGRVEACWRSLSNMNKNKPDIEGSAIEPLIDYYEKLDTGDCAILDFVTYATLEDIGYFGIIEYRNDYYTRKKKWEAISDRVDNSRQLIASKRPDVISLINSRREATKAESKAWEKSQREESRRLAAARKAETLKAIEKIEMSGLAARKKEILSKKPNYYAEYEECIVPVDATRSLEYLERQDKLCERFVNVRRKVLRGNESDIMLTQAQRDAAESQRAILFRVIWDKKYGSYESRNKPQKQAPSKGAPSKKDPAEEIIKDILGSIFK